MSSIGGGGAWHIEYLCAWAASVPAVLVVGMTHEGFVDLVAVDFTCADFGFTLCRFGRELSYIYQQGIYALLILQKLIAWLCAWLRITKFWLEFPIK